MHLVVWKSETPAKISPFHLHQWLGMPIVSGHISSHRQDSKPKKAKNMQNNYRSSLCGTTWSRWMHKDNEQQKKTVDGWYYKACCHSFTLTLVICNSLKNATTSGDWLHMQYTDDVGIRKLGPSFLNPKVPYFPIFQIYKCILFKARFHWAFKFISTISKSRHA